MTRNLEKFYESRCFWQNGEISWVTQYDNYQVSFPPIHGVLHVRHIFCNLVLLHKQGDYLVSHMPVGVRSITWTILKRVDCNLIIRASSCNFFYSFLNSQSIFSSVFWGVSRNFMLQLFVTFSIFACNIYCNFYQVLRKM